MIGEREVVADEEHAAAGSARFGQQQVEEGGLTSGVERRGGFVGDDDLGFAQQGAGGGDALLAAMKGQVFESPRGKVFIDAQTRDIVQDVYLRKVERVNGQLYNVEFDVIKDVKDPGKTK